LGAAIALAVFSPMSTAQTAGQVTAHVGPDDVTQQELDNELRRSNVPFDRLTDAEKKAALGRLVERKYLMQQATAMKLDSDPVVRLDLLRGREQILSTAYAQRELTNKATAISQAEMDDYIHAHPAQFAKRQLFQVEQVSFPPLADLSAITTAMKDFSSLDQVEAKLKERGVNFTRGKAMMDGASMPAELLSRVQARKPGDIFLIRSKTGGQIFDVIAADEKPQTGDDARRSARLQMIADLARMMQRQTLDAALASARYEGDYARIMAAPTPPPNLEGTADGKQPQDNPKPADDAQEGPPKN